MGIVYLNGELLAQENAKISVLDRGFIFADGVYEVIPVYNRHIFRFKEHFQRLESSLKAIHLTNPYTETEWGSVLHNVIDQNQGNDQSLYLQVTRGVAERDHIFDDEMKPTVFIMSRSLRKKNHIDGVHAIVTEDIRWKYCDIKSIALLPSVLLRYQAKQQGAREAILVRDGMLTEGAASNVFIVKQGEVMTPAKDEKVLPGITRDLVIELLNRNGIPCQESNIHETELKQADEIWLTSSTQEIIPVIKLDNQVVGDGTVGPVWQKINKIYQEFKREFSSENL